MYNFRTNIYIYIYTCVCMCHSHIFVSLSVRSSPSSLKRRVLERKWQILKRTHSCPRDNHGTLTDLFRKLVSEKRNSSIAQGKPQLTSFLRYRKPHCFLCGTNSSTGEAPTKRRCNDMEKARRAEKIQTNVCAVGNHRWKNQSAVTVMQGKSVMRKRLTECFLTAELIARGSHSVLPPVHPSAVLPPHFAF
jgi:hypothetical protein